MKKQLLFPALVLVVLAALTGCGKDDDPGATTDRSTGDAGVGFGKCMRDSGFPWYPDDDGTGRLGAEPPAGVVVDQQKLEKAQQACMEKAVNNGGKGPAVPSAEDLVTLKAYAKCMRDNGLPKFPDPGADGTFDTRGAGIRDDTPEWKKATEACRKLELGPKDRRTEGGS